MRITAKAIPDKAITKRIFSRVSCSHAKGVLAISQKLKIKKII
jgi:hypothetical protein